jgi:hypothetical protein
VIRWQQALQPYYQLNWTNPAYHCPAYNGAIMSPTFKFLQDTTSPGFLYGSYSYNAYGAGEDVPVSLGGSSTFLGIGVTGAGVGDNKMPAHSDVQVVEPAETFAIMDTAATIPYGSSWSQTTFLNQGTPPPYWIGSGWTGIDWASCIIVGLAHSTIGPSTFLQLSPKQHGQFFNVLSCDGHVASVRLTNLFNPESTGRNWNFDHQPHPELW